MSRRPVDLGQTTFSLDSGQFGSFVAPFTWRFQEQMTILCGPNGAGKSQLLRMTEEALAPATSRPKASHKLAADKPCCSAAEVMYLPPGWELSPGGVQRMQNVHEHVLGRVEKVARNRNHQVRGAEMLQRALQSRLGPRFQHASAQELLEALKPHEVPALEDWHHRRTPEVFSQLFVDYYLRQVDARERGVLPEAFEEQCGPPPWTLLNDFLQECASPFRVESPRGILGEYDLTVRDEVRELTLRPSDLSSGEQTLFSLAIWLYGAASDGYFPRVLLLDETDAHLHTAAIPGFLRALRSVLARKYGCAIVLATHRPDTIATAVEAELFLVGPVEPRLKRSPNRSAALSGITDNLFTLVPSIRVFLVEDVADREFYESAFHAVKNVCSDVPSVAAVFRPCATGTGRSRIPGGRGAVRSWVRTFRTDELECLIHGIVDGDEGSTPEAGVHVLPRYSFENFLVDPLVIAATLIESESPPPLLGTRELRPGQSGRLSELEADDLQDVANWVLAQLTAPQDQSKSGGTQEIVYTSGKSISVPTWILRSKGKSLVGGAIEAFDRKFDREELRRGFVRLQMIPADLRGFVVESLGAA